MTFFLGLFMAFQLHLGSPAPQQAELGTVMSEPDIVLSLKPPLVSGNAVKLGYQIPYPGYIEFHLFGPDGTKIWQNFTVREKGEYYQSVKRSPLEAGATYRYEFWYKGKPYEGTFTN